MTSHGALVLLLSIVVLRLREARLVRAVLLERHRQAHLLDQFELQFRAGR